MDVGELWVKPVVPGHMMTPIHVEVSVMRPVGCQATPPLQAASNDSRHWGFTLTPGVRLWSRVRGGLGGIVYLSHAAPRVATSLQCMHRVWRV